MRILLVDDSPFQREALASILRNAGHTDLVMASSGTGALLHLEDTTPGMLDLILMDLDMPGLNGIESTQRVKAMEGWRDIPIIMVTSSDDADDLKLAFAAGAMDYITKPPNEVELLARVNSALRLKRETDRRRARELDLKRVNHRLEYVLGNLAEQHQLLQLEQAKSDRLLLNILPEPIAERLKSEPGVIAERFEEATVLFADIVGFTPLSARVRPEELVTLLNEVFSMFDRLADKHGLEKIKTIGDAYMAVAGVPMPRADHAQAVADMALDIQREMPHVADGTLQVRIGIHSGPVVAGVIGQKKFSYDLWGDTVNVAGRMESQGLVGAIQVTAETYVRLRDRYLFAERGPMQVKGRGEMMTYFLLRRKDESFSARTIQSQYSASLSPCVTN